MESISKEKIIEIMKHAPPNIGTMRFIFEGIETAHPEHRGELLNTLYMGMKFVQSDETLVFSKENSLGEINSGYLELIEEKLRDFREDNPKEEEFYEKLVDFIWDEDIFKDNNERFQAVVIISYSNLIPYCQLEDTSEYLLGSDAVRTIVENIQPERLSHFNYILNSILYSYPMRFICKTQSAHLLLKELAELNTDQERAVMLVKILDFYQHMHIGRLNNTYGGNEND